MSDSAWVTGFSPVAPADARWLVLGSMPGAASLQAEAYYAHPRNAFWPIVSGVFEANLPSDYTERLSWLATQKVALWDVLKQCQREGSLDASIVTSSVQPNDFDQLFTRCPQIQRVLFNGAKAEQLFKRHVGFESLQKRAIVWHRMPSTSPAYAALSIEKKRHAWQQGFLASSG